jgi:hypothetical protein
MQEPDLSLPSSFPPHGRGEKPSSLDMHRGCGGRHDLDAPLGGTFISRAWACIIHALLRSHQALWAMATFTLMVQATIHLPTLVKPLR